MNPIWALLGEAYSKAQHLSGTALQPGLAADLGKMYLAKGAHATTAIEGNTLTEAEVRAILDEGARMPPSQQYLETAVRNVAVALHQVRASAMDGSGIDVSTEWIRDQNARVLADLPADDHVVPGAYRAISVGAGPYLAAPAEDVDYLMEELVKWLSQSWLVSTGDTATTDDQRFFRAFFAAVLGHLYVAWIHPFGDGNGRTARLLEAAILAHSGVVPWVSCNLLSDHYNRTRDEYYRRLQAASQRDDVDGFIMYAAQGLVDGLREQINRVQKMQRQVAWVNFVHEIIGNEPKGVARDRRLHLVLGMPIDTPVPRSQITKLDTTLVGMYFDKGEKTLTRDLNRLKSLELLHSSKAGWWAAIDRMDAFVPVHRKGSSPSVLPATRATTARPRAAAPKPRPEQPSLIDEGS